MFPCLSIPFSKKPAKKNENKFLKWTNIDSRRVTSCSMNNHRREALSFFFDCNGGYGWPTAERVD